MHPIYLLTFKSEFNNNYNVEKKNTRRYGEIQALPSPCIYIYISASTHPILFLSLCVTSVPPSSLVSFETSFTF